MLLLATAMSGEKRGGEGGVLVQRKMAAGVCGSYTSELECRRSVRLASRVGEQRLPRWALFLQHSLQSPMWAVQY